MASGIDRLKKLLGEEEEEEKERRQTQSAGSASGSVSGRERLNRLLETSDASEPANRKSKEAARELREFGQTTYGGKDYTLPKGTLSEYQKRVNAYSAAAPMSIAKAAENALDTARSRDADWWQEEKNRTSADATKRIAKGYQSILDEKKEPEPRDYTVPAPATSHALTPDLEAEYVRRANAQGTNVAPGAWTQNQMTKANERQKKADRNLADMPSGWKYAAETADAAAVGFEKSMGQILGSLDKADYWIMKNLGIGTFGGLDINSEAANEAAHAIDTDIQNAIEDAKKGKGPWARRIIDAFSAAGNIFGSSMAGYGLGGMGALSNAVAPVASRMASATAPVGASAASRLAALGTRFAGNVIGDLATSGTNAIISAQSGIGTYDRARSYGADHRTAATAGFAAFMAEYISNKMFNGTPLEDAPGEKGYVIELIEDIAERMGKKGGMGAKMETALKTFFGNKFVSHVFDKSGEGLEEVITRVIDPMVEKLTYNKDADLATFSDLLEEYIGGVLMSVVMSVPGTATNTAKAAVNAMQPGVDIGSAGWMGNTYNGITARLSQNRDYAEKSRGNAETAAKAKESGSESLQRYAGIYDRLEATKEILQGADPEEMKDEAFVNELEAGNYFYIWETQGAKAADAYYDQYVRAAAQNRKAQTAEDMRQIREKTQRREAERAAQDRAMLAEDAARQREAAQRRAAPPLPQQARQITPESVTTPPVPGNAQRGAESAGRTGERIATAPAGPRNDGGRETGDSLISPSGTASPKGSQVAGEEPQTLGNPLWTKADAGTAEGWNETYTNAAYAFMDALKTADPALYEAYRAENQIDRPRTKRQKQPITNATNQVQDLIRAGVASPLAAATYLSERYHAGTLESIRRFGPEELADIERIDEQHSAANPVNDREAGQETLFEESAGNQSGLRVAAREQTENRESGSGLRIVGETENKERMLWTAPKNYTEWAARYGDDKPAADAMRAAGDTALMGAFMDEAASENADKPIVEAYLAAWESVKQGTISPMAAVGIVSEAYRSAGADGTRALVDPGSGNLTKEALNAAKDIDRKHRGGLRVGQAENPAAAVGQQANAGQTETAPAAEAAEAGNDLADGGRGGLSGQRAGEQDGRVAKLAEARSAVSQFDTASRRRSDAKNLPSERVNARDHIAEAAEGSTLAFAPEQMVQQDKELRTVKRRLESITGRKVYYTLGGIRRTGADGKTGTARAAITPDGIYLRCDDDSASVTQLAGHELYHYYEEQFPGLHDKVRQKITERYSEEKFREVARRYAEKLGRLNGMAEDMDAESYEAMLRRIESEIFADAFGNINYFRLGADRYTDAARETVNETLGQEAAAATERRTGPPETRFSFDERSGAKNIESLTEHDVRELLENTENGEYADRTYIPLRRNTPEILISEVEQYTNGETKIEDLPIISEVGHLRQVMDEDTGSYNPKYRPHNMSANDMISVIKGMDDPAYIVLQENGRFVEVVRYRGESGEGRASWAVLDIGEEKNPAFMNGYPGGTYNVLVTPFEPDDLDNYMKNHVEKIIYDKAKDVASRGSNRQWSSHTYATPFADEIVAETTPDVKTSFSASEDEDIPESAAEYSRQRYREENREPQSAAEYSQMKQRALEREAEIRKLEKKGEASAEDRREAAWARREFESPKEKANKQQATIAKKDLRNTIISEFGIPDGRKAEIGKLIDAYADQAYKDGKLTETDRQALFDKLYSEGVMTVPADDAFQAAREIIKGGRVYVPERVKHEFGDDWGGFRREAFAEGILLTNNKDDMSWDSWNVELSAELPGLFAEDETDPRDFLERVVHLAREGRDQEMSLAEYAATVIGTEYVSEDELLANMERKLDWALRSYADKAGLEIWMKNKTEEKLAKQREKFGERLDREKAQRLAKEQKEREKRKEAARKQTMNRELREMQQRTLKMLQQLKKNRQRFYGDLVPYVDEILSDIDLFSTRAADEAHIDRESGMTWREMADIYKAAKENDPNFLPSKDLERIVARLDNRKIGDMDIDAVTDLYKAAWGLLTELNNRNKAIGGMVDDQFDTIYKKAKSEIQGAKGGYQSGAKGTAQKFFSDLQLTPMNLLERMAGWNKDSAWYKMAKQLEQGERAQRKFKTDSARMLAPFLEDHKEWVKKADGQGKDAIWYEVEVPELLELGMGDKPIFGNTVKVWMTPAQKVHMYLESQNYDNLRHMTGGRTFADKELYSKGKRAEAFAQGKTIRLAPESVKNLVKDLTPEEKALADALRPFYNEFSKKEINRVSNLLLGYDKAMEGDYAPIYTNQNYTKSEPGIFDTTAEGVGNLKSRVYSSNPSLNISALDAFEKSVDRTSRYVGLAIPVRDMNTLMNWREKNNSMADVLTHKWGEDGKRFVNDLLTELQSGRETEQSSIEKLTNAALSRYISAVFGANPSIVMKQFASYPLAAAYLGWDNMPLNVPRAARVDTDLIAKYTGEYDYRQLGYAMPETATLKDNPGKLQERGPLNFIFGGGAITWMDGFTVRTLWTWAENKVNKEQPGLERGSKEQIDAGNSEYYKAVAAEFEEALSRSQPMYDTMHRANIMRESNPITRAFTLFKTVPMQEYNMLRQAIGEAQYAKEAKLDKETQAAARQKAGRAFAGILTGNLMIGAITILNALWKNRGKKYRDEDGELSAEKLIAEAGKQYFKDAAGLVIGGGEAADILSSILFGDKWYGLETPGMEQIESILEQTVKAGQTVQGLVKDSIEVLANGGNWAQYMADHSDKYLSAVDSVARTLGTYATGLPIDNVKAYLLGAVQWLSPEINTAYEDALKKADRSGLKGLRGASLEIRTKNVLQERAGSAEDSTVEALAGLYEAGYKDAIPAAQVTKITVDGEERQLNLAQQQTYKRAWQSTVGGSIDELVGSKDFQNADEATQAKMLKKLYDLANKKAASALFDDYEDSAIGKADAYTEAGASLADYAAMSGAVSGLKRAESYETILGSDMSDEAKLAAIGNIIGTDMVTETGNPTQWARLNTAVKDGLSVDRAMELMQSNLLDDYVKYSEAGVDRKNADSLVTAISKLKPEEGYEEVRGVQKWNAIISTVSGSANQEKALKASMTESQWKAYKDSGVGAELYVKFKYDTRNYTSTRDAEGKEVKGQAKKDKMIAYIDGLNASAAQKDALYLTEYKESGLSDTPWHKGGGKGSGSYAMSRTPALRIPEAPRAEKNQSGLKISTGETTQRPSSGLRIRGTQPSEARQSSGLRIRDAAPAAQAPRSGLRIRAK